MMPNIYHFGREPALIRIIMAVLSRNSQVASSVSFYCQPLLRDDRNVNSWVDNWTVTGQLRVGFVRIFALAFDKAGLVKKFGQWEVER